MTPLAIQSLLLLGIVSIIPNSHAGPTNPDPTTATRSGVQPAWPAALSAAAGLAAQVDTWAQAASQCEITTIEAASGATFKQRDDGAWLASGNSEKTDTLTLALDVKTGGSFLKLDFLTDPSLPWHGPGRCQNPRGSVMISEIEIEIAGKRMEGSVWKANNEGQLRRFADKVFDGIRDKNDARWAEKDSAWELLGSQPSQLIVLLDHPIKAGQRLTVRVIAQSNFGEYQVPGCMKACVFGAESEAKTFLPASKAFMNWCAARDAQLKRVLPNAQAVDKTLISGDLRYVLAVSKILDRCNRGELLAVMSRPGGETFLHEFFGDIEWMESTLLMVGLRRPVIPDDENWPMRTWWDARAMDRLRILHRHDQGLKHPVYRRLATVLAARGPNDLWYLISTYDRTKTAHQKGRILGYFDQLTTHDMQYAVDLNVNVPYTMPGNSEVSAYEATLDLRQTKASLYGVFNNLVPYGGNPLDGTVNPRYFTHCYGLGTPTSWANSGGICGATSGTVKTVANARGVSSMNSRQPGHYTYLYRAGNRWHLGNSLGGGASGDVYNQLFYDGYLNSAAVFEAVHGDAPNHLLAMQRVWAAQLLGKRNPAYTYWLPAYEASLRAQPKNYEAWEDYLNELAESPDVPARLWADVEKRIIKAYSSAPELEQQRKLGHQLAQRCFEKYAAALTPAQRAKFAAERHHDLFIKSADPKFDFVLGTSWIDQIDAIIQKDASLINDPGAEGEWIGRLLPLYHLDAWFMRWVFNEERLKKMPQLTFSQSQALVNFIESADGGWNVAKSQEIACRMARIAANNGDRRSLDIWQKKLGQLFTPTEYKAYLRMQGDAEKTFPKFERFPGVVLSEKALLQTSNRYDTYDVLYDDRTLSDKAPGFCSMTRNAGNVQVMLDSPSEITGIVMVPRYDRKSPVGEALPLKISTSEDGENWKEITEIKWSDSVCRIDLQGKAVKAKWIRASRLYSNEIFEMRNFIVYGNPPPAGAIQSSN